jgi:hypothetical protein
MPPRPLAVIAAVAAIGAAGCGDDEDPSPPPAAERTDAPVAPPPGWRTVANRGAGFTVALPGSWRARGGEVTQVRSADGLVVMTFAADRGRAARSRAPAEYAREVVGSLPGLEGTVSPRVRRVGGSPYATAVVSARGRLPRGRAPQRIQVAVFQRPGRVTYSAVVFRNAAVRVPGNDRVVRRALRSFRAQPRSGRSG